MQQPIPTPTLFVNEQRMFADFTELSEIGATADGGVNRPALSNEDLRARAWFADRVEEAGLLLRDDDAGNLSGFFGCGNRSAKTLILGSHLDSVPNGGRYDGAIGVLAALEVLRTIKDSSLRLPVHLEAINFTDEEGYWQSLFGSRGLTGTLKALPTSDKDADYGPFRAALFRAGIRPADVNRAKRDRKTIAAYLELHIEQGARLDREGIDLGIVSGIVGRSAYQLTFFGQASHSGTTEADSKRDALLGAAAFIVIAHRLAREKYPQAVFNCGALNIRPGATNIVPAEATIRMELRHPDGAALGNMEAELLRLAQDQAVRNGLSVSAHRVMHVPVATLPEDIVEIAENVCVDLDISHRRIVSYAGHDGQVMSQFTPVGMVFVPSVGGISHNPKEFTRWESVVQGANVLLHTAIALAQRSASTP